MSLTSRPNECASRAVIALQLATWSAVGIILLQKGASSLRRSNAASVRNDSLAQIGVPAEAQIEIRTFDVQRQYEDGSSNLAVIPLQDDSSDMITERRPARSDRQTTRGEDSLDESQESAKDDASRETVPTTVSPKKKKHKIPSLKEKKNDTISTMPDANGKKQSQQLLRLAQESDEESESTNDDRNEDDSSEERSRRRGHGPPEVKAARATAPAGTVAAIAMLAVGAVMLVLGPAAVILRALDDRRQKRRFLKLSAADDLPPTYEQATLMDEAPRYSTLVLDRSDSAFSTSQLCAAVASIEQDAGSPRQTPEPSSSGT